MVKGEKKEESREADDKVDGRGRKRDERSRNSKTVLNRFAYMGGF